MYLRELPLAAAPRGEQRVRALAAAVLRLASRTLETLAQRLALVHHQAGTEPVIEFHADAGAPEGALYVDGKLVGHVLGVTRL